MRSENGEKKGFDWLYFDLKNPILILIDSSWKKKFD